MAKINQPMSEIGSELRVENLEKMDKTEKRKVDLDTILLELGQFGMYQFRMMLVVAVVVVFSGWAAVEYIFTTARIETRCLIPECETADSAVFQMDWLWAALPPSGSGFDNCQRYATNNTSPPAAVTPGTCPATLFDSSEVVQCEEYVYAAQDSIVYDFGLACDEWRRSLVGTVRTAGVMIALPLTGFVSDRWGRRTALVINAFNTAWLGVVRYFAFNYTTFVVSQVVEAALGAGNFACAYILVMELVGPKYRVAAGATMSTCFAIGQMTMGLIAWGVQRWDLLTLALYIPQLSTILLIWLLQESVRWYISKDRYEDSERILNEVARVNKKTLSATSLKLLRENAEEKKRQQQMKIEKKSEPWLIVLLLQNKRVLLRVVVTPVWWITTTFVYYGLSINSINMSGNRYLNYVAVSAIEIPGFWTAFVLMNAIGRKPVLAGAFWICAATQLAYIFTPDGLAWLSTLLYLMGKYAIATVMTSIYVYTAEIYPTKYRNTLLSFASMMGRIGTMTAPLTPAFATAVWDNLPFALFGGFALVSGALVLLTPETLGTSFPDTMEEANELGTKKPNKYI